MTIPVSDRLSQLYVGNGTNKRFDFTFRVFQQEDETGISIRKKGAVEFETLDPSTYIVQINQDDMGGYVTFNTAPESGTYFYIAGTTSLDQLLDITNYDNFYPDAIERALDKLTALLQERITEIDQEKQSRILADLKYDALAMEREDNLENRLTSYINAMLGVTNPAIFDGISDRMIITKDGRTQREFNESIPFWTDEFVKFMQETYLREEQILDSTDLNLQTAKTELDTKINNETSRALEAESLLDAAIAATAGGYFKSYPTLAQANADIANIPLNVSIKVLSVEDGGDYYKATANATSLTKSPYDPLAQAKEDVTEKVAAALTTASNDASTKAQAAETNAKQYADAKKLDSDTVDTRLQLAIQQLINALSLFRSDFDSQNTAQQNVNTTTAESLSLASEENTKTNTRVARLLLSIQQLSLVLNMSVKDIDTNTETAKNLNLAFQQFVSEIQSLTGGSDSPFNEDKKLKDLFTNQQFIQTLGELLNASDSPFNEDKKLKDLILKQEFLREFSKLTGFDPSDAGSNKYVEAEKIVFFPEPQNVIRIDIETGQALPTAKGTVINTVTAINVDGQILKNFGTLEVQGSSSAAFPKKNWTLCLFSDEARTTAIKIKLGHMIVQEELVFKANFVDNTHTRNIACNRLWQQFVDSRVGFPKSEVDAVNMLNSDLSVENYNGLTYMPTGATGHVDGFPAAIYINGVFYGIGTLNIGKKRDNYNLDKNTQKHIQVEPQGNWTGGVSYTNLPEHPDDANSTFGTYFEIRRPSSWKAEAQGYWTRLRAYTSLSREDMQAAGIDNYFNRKNLMDYIILLQVCDLWDHLGKNALITTWDGNIWNFMPYDLDTVFGLDWLGNFYNENGAAKHPATDVLIGQNWSAGNSGFFSKCRRVYGVDIDARYAALRRAKIIDVDNIIQLCEEILRKFPTDLLKAENTRWNTGSNSIYTSLLQTSSIHQIQTWLSVHIPVCDSYFNYTTTA